ncbi:hypothetical protein GGR53DRAFT_513445 [Hypoxylon sp. FL1150]|nr:hypothetical protein GGR53DRAFT_513445 [Hypoxylon sp. FL1150]
MCVEIRRKYQHCECSTYLDTHICNAALGLDEYDDNVLSETKFLPDKPRKIPNGCSLKIATSPSAASCPRCEREKRMAGTTTNATAAAATAQPARTTPVPAAALQGKVLLDLKILPGDGGQKEQLSWI